MIGRKSTLNRKENFVDLLTDHRDLGRKSDLKKGRKFDDCDLAPENQ